MLNPWLSLSFQAARLGWDTQSMVVDHMMRLAGVGNSDRHPAGALEHNTMAVPVRNEEAPPAPVVKVAAPANSGNQSQVVQQGMKNQKKHRRVKKRRRSHSPS
jgi:hypothetical protein